MENETLSELRKWVAVLSPTERRSITMLSRARSAKRLSQQWELFHWLSESDEGSIPPKDAEWLRNLPTVAKRLKELILDGLRLIQDGDGPDAKIRRFLDDIALLHEKQLHAAAMKLIRRCKTLAMETCRYAEALLCLNWEQRLLHAMSSPTLRDQLVQLRDQEANALRCLTEFQDLRHRHDRLLLLVRHGTLPRQGAATQAIAELTQGAPLERFASYGRYPERALATNVLGIKDWIERKPMAAVERYATLLQEWQSHPEWLMDQAPLLLTICNYFQSACFYSRMDWEQARSFLALVPDFQQLAPEVARDYQRMLFHNQLTPALNTGNLESAKDIISQIDRWLLQQGQHLSEAQVLPFLHNMAIAEFIMGRHTQANRFLQRILNLPNRQARKDIRDFALVLQAILQYEMGNFSLNEYLTRAGKRHFHKYSDVLAFEFSIFKFLELAMHLEPGADLRPHLDNLASELQRLAEQVPAAVLILGLVEIRLWVTAKQQGRTLESVYLETIREHLHSMP
ncbi:MAG: hypothetical protein U0176_00315 [Bacteroidia bacterium]